MELTITPSHTWLFVQVLSSLAQITTAVGVLVWYSERRSERRREPPTQNTENLIMFEDEVTSDSPAENLGHRYRPHRIRDGSADTALEARAGARHSTPKYTSGSCRKEGILGDASFSAPRLYNGRPRGLRHRPPPLDAESEDETELSDPEDSSSTTSTEEPVRRNSAGYPETGALQLPRKRSRQRSTSYQPSTESEITEGKLKGSIAKSKGNREDDGKSKTSASSSDSSNAHSPGADGLSKRSRRASLLHQSFTKSGSMEEKLEGSVAQYKGQGKTERRGGTSTPGGSSSRAYSPEDNRPAKRSEGGAGGSAKGKGKARADTREEERDVPLGSQPARKKQHRDKERECHTLGSGTRTKSSRPRWEEW